MLDELLPPPVTLADVLADLHRPENADTMREVQEDLRDLAVRFATARAKKDDYVVFYNGDFVDETVEIFRLSGYNVLMPHDVEIDGENVMVCGQIWLVAGKSQLVRPTGESARVRFLVVTELARASELGFEVSHLENDHFRHQFTVRPTTRNCPKPEDYPGLKIELRTPDGEWPTIKIGAGCDDLDDQNIHASCERRQHAHALCNACRNMDGEEYRPDRIVRKLHWLIDGYKSIANGGNGNPALMCY